MNPSRPANPTGPALRLGFRDRIAVLVALPLVAVALTGVSLFAAQLDTAREAGAAADRARTARAVAPLLRSLAAERTLGLASVVLAVESREPLLARHAQTRALAGSVAGAPDARPDLDGAVADLSALDAVREAVLGRTAGAGTVDGAYASAIDGILRVVEAGGEQEPAVAVVLEGARQDAVESALVLAAVDPGRANDAAAVAIGAAATAELHQRSVERAAVPAVAVAADRGGRTRARTDELAAGLRGDPAGFAIAQAPAVPTLLADITAAAAVRAVAVDQEVAVAAAAAGSAAATAAAGAVVLGATFLLLGGSVMAVGLRNGRSVSRPLLALASAADEVAELARAELLRVADGDEDVAPAPVLAAVNVEATDELGALAAAFNRVQAVAALLLERQTLVRRNSAAMLAHVGRRTRTLVARQLDLIDALEQGEQDAERLDRLYRLDHLTSRLRRSADSLLVLAATRGDDMDSQPQTMVTAVRSALASIEGYRRVVIGELADVLLAPAAHADVTLLVAELLENAVAFSPPTSPVTVDVATGPDGVRLTVVDHGVGIAPAELDRHNEAFLRRERLEVAPTDVLGLVVVGRIARRHDIAVELLPTPQGGVTALVVLPRAVLVAAPQRARNPPVAPAPPGTDWFAPAPPPGPTAAAATGGAAVAGHANGNGNGSGHGGPGVPRPRPAPARPAPLPPLRRRVPARPRVGEGRHALRAESLGERAVGAMAAELDRAVVRPGLRTGAPPGPQPVAEPPAPAGAQGLQRRVRGARLPVDRAEPPLLGVAGDALAARRLVQELEAGVERAVAETRGTGARTGIFEEDR